MDLRALLSLTLLGLLRAELGSAQRGDMDINEWIKSKAQLIKNLEDKLKNVDRCQSDVEALEARLNATVDELTRQKGEVDRLNQGNEGLRARLDSAEKEIDKLKENTDKGDRHVAFSASLSNTGDIYRGPCTDKRLVFRRVFSNTGNGYDPNTGIFRASVKGLYYLSFSTYGYNTHVMGAILMKNHTPQIATYEYLSSDGSDSSSNSVVLQLDSGDEVYMELWDNGRVFDNLNGHTTFSGFLLFPM